MQRLCVIDVVGLTPRHLCGALAEAAPRLTALATAGGWRSLTPVLPAVTCSAQATMLTGVRPAEHGIVGNGWHRRETDEIRFWLQSRHQILAEPLYETARQRLGAEFSCASLFWWFNEARGLDWRVTPKPFYATDGAKAFAIDGAPEGLAGELEAALGPFPFPAFWGPRAGIASTAWIARASAHVLRTRRPALTLVYLPHLDYDLQRLGGTGPHVAPALRALDREVGVVLDAAEAAGARLLVVSEYGITDVARPVFLNRVLREAGWLKVRPGPFGERLALFASDAVAVADHQVAHVTVRAPALIETVRERLLAVDGVADVLDRAAQRALGLDHPRAGELVAIAESDAWFAYHFWLDAAGRPDFAPTVDIHNKPGYDPAELFIDPGIRFPRLRVLRRLLARKLGFRTRFDLVPVDPALVRGSHGRLPRMPDEGPLVIAGDHALLAGLPDGPVAMTSVRDLVLAALGALE